MDFSIIKNRLAVLLMVLLMVVSSFALAPSKEAPGGVSNPPQLIVLGSDDNTSAEGINWIVDYIKSKKNKDGSALRMSFYSNTKDENGWDDKTSPIVQAHIAAYKAGNEVSNHTANHVYTVETEGDMKRMSVAEIKAEMDYANNKFIDFVGVDAAHLAGFRTPFLAYSDSTFTAMEQAGFQYDCSINEGDEWDGAIAGQYYWPYTLSERNSEDMEKEAQAIEDYSYSPGNGSKWSWWNSTYKTPVRQHSNLWELPCYMYSAPDSLKAHMDSCVTYDHGMKITALDYNMWHTFKLNRQQTTDVLKNTLDLMYNGNRTPFTVGMHTPFYTSASDKDYPSISSTADRRKSLEDFIDYAITKDDVWFVSGDMVIAYMKNPVEASEFKPEDYAVIPIDGGTITPIDSNYVEVLNIAAWNGSSDKSESDANLQCGSDIVVALDSNGTDTIVTATGNLTLGVVKINDPDTVYPSSSFEAMLPDPSNMVGVTDIEVTYTATEDFKLNLPMTGVDGAHEVLIAKGINITEKFAIGDFSQPSWVEAADKVDYDATKSNIISFILAHDDDTVGATGKIDITSLKLYGYTAPKDTDTTPNTDTLELVGDNASWEAWYDTANSASVTVDSANNTINVVNLKQPDGSDYAAFGTTWIKDDKFTFEGVKRVEITYTSTADLTLSAPMTSTADDGSAHKVDLPASSTDKKINIGIYDLRQPDGVTADLNLSKIIGLELNLNGVTEGSITVKSVRLIYVGDEGTPVSISGISHSVKSIKPAITAISSSRMNLSVPESGNYSVKIYSVNGQLIRQINSSLIAGVNSISMNNGSMASKMVIVQISGKGINFVTKAMIK